MTPIVTRNLVRYLIDKGLLDRTAVVDGGLALTMGRSRNRFVLVKQRHGPSYFIKQAIETEPGSRQTIAREAEIYRGAFADDRLLAMRDLLPQFHLYDADQGILVNELVTDAETMAAIHQRDDGCAVELAAMLGGALAACHRIRFVEGAPQAALFPQQAPWILRLHGEKNLTDMRRSPASSQLVDLILATPATIAPLSALRDGWRRDTLIHTDMRWENCLLSPRRASPADQRLHIIDWELADIGDAAWDVGSLLQSYLASWIGSMPAGDDPDALAAGARIPLDALKPAIAAFWHGYIAANDAYRDDAAGFLDRCIGMMAARMLVTAFERSVWSQATDRTAMLLTQTAINILATPPRTVALDLLGIADAAPAGLKRAQAA